jgi:hypothetical protein
MIGVSVFVAGANCNFLLIFEIIQGKLFDYYSEASFEYHYVIISSFLILRYLFYCMGLIIIVELEKGEDESGKNKCVYIYIYI